MANKRHQYRLEESFREKRNEQRKRYYGQFNKDAENKHARYSDSEIKMILEHSIPDRELAEELGRSVQAIQLTRWKYSH